MNRRGRQRSTARFTGVWTVRLRQGLVYSATSLAAATAAVGISLFALSALVLVLGASGVGGLAVSGQPLHAAVDDGAVAFYLTQLVSVSFFHHTAGLRLAVLPGLALVAVREAGLSAQMELAGRSLKGQLKQAERLGARFFAVVEPESVLLRDLRAGTEETVDRDALLDRVVTA